MHMQNYIAMVEVLPKEEILDPEGEMLRQRLSQQTSSVSCHRIRAGRLFEMRVSAPNEAAATTQVETWLKDWLVNPVVQVGNIRLVAV